MTAIELQNDRDSSSLNGERATRNPAPTFRQIVQQRNGGGRRRKGVSPCGAVVEALEDRTLRSVTSSVSGTTLTITGDTNNNKIELVQSNHVVSVYGDGTLLRTMTDTALTSVNIATGVGADTIFIAIAAQTSDPFGGATGTSGVNVVSNIDAGADDDEISASDQSDTIVGGSGADEISSYGGADFIEGDVASTTSNAQSASTSDGDNISAGAGNDTVLGQYGNDNIVGEAGNDSLEGDFASTTAHYGTEANDNISDSGGNNFVQGDSDGVLVGGFGSYGHCGADFISMGPNDDTVYGDGLTTGAAGNDVITLGDGANLCYGWAGDDDISGGSDSDTINGGDGNDSIRLFAGADSAFGDAGDDQFFNLFDMTGDYVDGGAGADSVVGTTDGSDTII